MPGFLRALQTRSRGEAARARVQEQDLRQWGLTGQWPRPSFLPGLPTRWDSPLAGGGTPRQERAFGAAGGPSCGFLFVFCFFYLRAPGLFLPAPAVGPDTGPGPGAGRPLPLPAQRGVGGRGMNEIPGGEAGPVRRPAHWSQGGGTW